MGLFTPRNKFFDKPSVSADKLKAKSGLTSNQFKTIEALTGSAKAADYRRKLWGRIRKFQDKWPVPVPEPPDIPEEAADWTPKVKAKGKLHVTVSKEARELIKTLAEGHVVSSKLKPEDSENIFTIIGMNREGKKYRIGTFERIKGLKIASDKLLLKGGLSIGTTLEGDKIRLEIKYSVPSTASILRSRRTQNQGEILRALSFQQAKKKIDKPLKSFRATALAPDLRDNLSDMLKNMFASDDPDEFFQLGATSIDNVTYQDFSDYIYLCDPEYAEPLTLQVVVPDNVIEANEAMDEEGIDSVDNTAFAINLQHQFFRHINERHKSQYGNYMTYNLYVNNYQAGVVKIIDILFADWDRVAHFESVYWAQQSEDEKRNFLQWIVISFELLSPWQNAGGYVNFWRQLNDWAINPEGFPDTHLFCSEDAISMHWLNVEAMLLQQWMDLSPYSESDGIASIVPLQVLNDYRCIIPQHYPFDLYRSGTYNLGLRLVYRQEWRPLGTQRGELVKTIPLAPKQVEKISSKTVRRLKTSHSAEQLKSTETTTETTDTTKDTSEVVREAANSFGWHVEATAGASFGFGSASLTAGAEGSSESRSQENSSSLSESMKKTASKLNTQSKILISTEGEETYEQDRATEIVNPNDEIALTYVFSKLQRQYEVLTQLSEVHNVVLIAEYVPEPRQITDEWVRKHDWILAKALLDDSFRETLTEISNETVQNTDLDTGLAQQLSEVMDTTISHLGDLTSKSTSLSLSEVDVAQESQSGYRQAMKNLYQKQQERQKILYKRCRLRQHIIKNILYYYRAIWEQEDPQQRILRYRKSGVSIPLQWSFKGEWGDLEDEWDVQYLNDLIENQAVTEEDDFEFYLDGDFIGDTEGESINLADLISPDGPQGYVGNYAVYSIKPEHDRDDIFAMMQIAKTPYLQFETVGVDSDAEVHASLIDPTFRRYQEKFKNKGPEDEAEKREMVDYVPELRLIYASVLQDREDEFFATDNDALFKQYYPEYRYRKDMTRRFLLDTNNLLIDILPGSGSALESFKFNHRIIDVYKAAEELKKIELENVRRAERIEEGQLADPDIERVTIVATDESLKDTGLLPTGTTPDTDDDDG